MPTPRRLSVFDLGSRSGVGRDRRLAAATSAAYRGVRAKETTMIATLRIIAFAGAALVAACASVREQLRHGGGEQGGELQCRRENARHPENAMCWPSSGWTPHRCCFARPGPSILRRSPPLAGLDAGYEQNIAIDRFGPGGVDNHSTLLIAGRRCPIEALSRVERPPGLGVCAR